jgi:large subunit ribosomal protein L24
LPGVDIRKNDEVQVIAGKDKGRRARVVNVLPDRGRIMVEGVARATRHSGPTKRNPQGGLVLKELFIDISNVQVVCRACGKATRVGHRSEGGVKARVCRRCEAEI